MFVKTKKQKTVPVDNGVYVQYTILWPPFDTFCTPLQSLLVLAELLMPRDRTAVARRASTRAGS